MRIMYDTNPHTPIVTPRQIVDELFLARKPGISMPG